MKPISFLILVCAFCSLLSADEPIRERIEWIDIWVTDADKEDLPESCLLVIRLLEDTLAVLKSIWPAEPVVLA